jgi:hypothetical protein
MDSLVLDLQTLIRQPSVSAKNEGIEECAKLVSKLLKKSGISSEILRLKKNVAPIVFGEIKSNKRRGRSSAFLIVRLSDFRINLKSLNEDNSRRKIGNNCTIKKTFTIVWSHLSLWESDGKLVNKTTSNTNPMRRINKFIRLKFLFFLV